MLLNVGDIIEVHGWVMLAKLEGGQQYKVMDIRQHGLSHIYVFSKPRGTKKIVAHYTSSVDLSIDCPSLNRIEIVKRAITVR